MPPDPPIIHVLMHIYTGLRSPSFPQILISPPLDQFLNEGLVSDISIEKMVKRVSLCVGAQGPEQPRYLKYTTCIYIVASVGQLSYTLSVV